MNANNKPDLMRGTQYAKEMSERSLESLSQPKKKKYPISSGPSSGYPPNAFLDQDQLTELIRSGSMRVSPRILLTIDENNKLHLKDTAADDLVSSILQDLAKSGIDTTRGVTRGQR